MSIDLINKIALATEKAGGWVQKHGQTIGLSGIQCEKISNYAASAADEIVDKLGKTQSPTMS